MKITPINQQLWEAISQVRNFAEDKANHMTDADYKYNFEELKESIALVGEFASCFGADGRVSQRGQIPKAWNKDTIFESETGYKAPITEEVSAEQKDANAKKLLEELT